MAGGTDTLFRALTAGCLRSASVWNGFGLPARANLRTLTRAWSRYRSVEPRHDDALVPVVQCQLHRDRVLIAVAGV